MSLQGRKKKKEKLIDDSESIQKYKVKFIKRPGRADKTATNRGWIPIKRFIDIMRQNKKRGEENG